MGEIFPISLPPAPVSMTYSTKHIYGELYAGCTFLTGTTAAVLVENHRIRLSSGTAGKDNMH